MVHVGIDLGTTFSLVAHVNAHGVPAVFPDAQESTRFQTPSVVHVGPDGALVGHAVEDLLDDDPTLAVARFAKLSMGTDAPVLTDHAGRGWSAEAISALIVRKLRRDATAFSQEDIVSAAVAVPAQFGDAQRRATKNAALLAGIPSITLVEEPVAAATYFGLADSPRDQTLFVYDLGGGTFDATVLQASPDGLFVLATEGTSKVGGMRFDEALMADLAQGFKRAHGLDALADGAARTQLRRAAEQMKIRLGRPAPVRQALLLCGRTHEVTLTRARCEALIDPLVAETLEACERCLAGAGLSWSMIDKVLLTGGSTLVPRVQERVRAASGKGGDRIVLQQPHQAVAFGAALVAAQAGGTASAAAPQLLQRIASCDLGLRVWDKGTGRPGMQVVVKRNTPLPVRHTTTVFTTRPDQRRMVLEVLQAKGGDDPPQSLGHFAFGPIERPRKNYPVEVTLAYDVEGIVKVTARDPETSREMERVLEDPGQGEAAALARLQGLVQSVRMP